MTFDSSLSEPAASHSLNLSFRPGLGHRAVFSLALSSQVNITLFEPR
jgi:hypothetical protein